MVFLAWGAAVLATTVTVDLLSGIGLRWLNATSQA